MAHARIIRFFAVPVIIIGIAISGLASAAGGADGNRHPVVPIRHVIFFIGDGMQMAHEVAASRYLYGAGDGLEFHRFPLQLDVATWDVTTYNYWAKRRGELPYDPNRILPWLGYNPGEGGTRPESLRKDGANQGPRLAYLAAAATDSASAATAWSTGFKTDDGNIAWLSGDPIDGALTTLAEQLRLEKGFAIGVVSTVPFSHATPAAHVSHNVDRDNYVAIAAEILRRFQPEVVIGGGHPKWTGKYKYLSGADYTALKTDGLGETYVFAERRQGADAAAALLAAAGTTAKSGKKLFGLFGGADGNFESPVPVDKPGAPEVNPATRENPLLKDCVSAALTVLSRDPEGFFVMFEQGDIDWANHTNDFRRLIGTMWDLNEAVRTAVAFIERPGDDITWSDTLLIVTADHGNSGMRLGEPLGVGDLPLQVKAAVSPCLSVYCDAYVYPEGNVTYASGNHTNELVRLYAVGSGLSLFEPYQGMWYPGTRIIDNTHIFHVMAAAAGLSHPSGLATDESTPADTK
ncbi:MAG: alkaline phosphatase [Desulfobacterales bacterium]